MLHPRIVRGLIDRIELKRGIQLVEYPVEKCIKVYDHFHSILQSDGKKEWYQRPNETQEEFVMAKWEREWIQNEMLMCSCSFEYWYYRYFFLKDKENRITRPEVMVSQQIFLDILREIDGKQLPKIIMVLKARQLGLSTVTEAIILWIALFRKGSHCIISSAEEEKSIQMSEMIWVALENLLPWMKPILTRDDRQKGPEFGYNDSDILIQHGSMKTGIGRGSTVIAAHVSEVSHYPNPDESIESSLIRAMHESRRMFLVLESTPRRKGDWWHRNWVKNREQEPLGRNKYTCVFLPWYVGTDKYPTKDWVRNHPIPENWKPTMNTLKQANQAALYVRETPLLRKYMGDHWKMPPEQMWFYEFEYDSAARDPETLKKFMAEMASDERSCFTSKRTEVYSNETIDRLEAGLGAKYVDYAFTGNGIDSRFHLKEFQSNGKKLNVEWQDLEGRPIEWKLVPLRETPADENLSHYLRVWELPKKGYNYSIGIDFAGGVGQDSLVMCVLRIGRDAYEPDVQVAQLKCAWISSPEAPPFANCLGILYGKHMSPVPEAYMCPEVQVSTGDPTSHQLAKLGYSNFHYMRRYDLRKTPGSKGMRRGWATVSWSRQMMLESLKLGLESGWIIVNSDDTVDEIKSQEAEELDSGKTKYEHADGEHDDCLFAMGIAYFCSHDDEALAERKGGKRPKPVKEREEPEIEFHSNEMGLAMQILKEERESEWYHEPTEDSYVY